MIMKRYPYDLKGIIDKYQEFSIKQEAIQKIAIQMTLGLHTIHQTGVIHCDLKPHNVMVDTEGGKKALKIIDFGLIEPVIVNGKHVEPKKDDPVKGTWNYMSRRAHQRQTMSRRDDWETLCFVIYAMVAKLPW